jgi:hypothetical protein
MDTDTGTSQLTLEVRHRPNLENPILVGSLKLKGEIPIRRDLNAGEQLTVQVADADGEIIATGLFDVGPPQFKDVKMSGVGVVGMERASVAEFDPEG